MKTYKSQLPQIELKYKKGDSYKVKITSSKDIFEMSKQIMNLDTLEINEEVVVVFLNRANNTIGWLRHTSGGAISSIIDVKLILVAAINSGSQNLIIIHNHPSGNCKASQSDISMAKKLKEACILLDLTLLDSVIIAADFESYLSFADEGML
jgi:DNA repair protein RadC